MPTVHAKVEDAFLERIRLVCKWEKKTQEELLKSALEDRINRHVKRLEAMEKAEEKILKTVPLNDAP